MTEATALSFALLEAVRSVDWTGRVAPASAHVLRRAIERSTAEEREALAFEPGRMLGDFEGLLPGARRAISSAVAGDDRWAMAGHELGSLHQASVRLLRSLGRKAMSGGMGTLARLFEIAAVSAECGPARLLHSLYRAGLMIEGRVAPGPRLGAVLRCSGIEARDLACCYARGVPQPAAYRGFWHDASRRIAYGMALGIDFVGSSGGYWFIEANLNFGMSRTRSLLYGEAPDPLVVNMVSFARQEGFRRLVVIHNSSSRMNREMTDQYWAAAKDMGIDLMIIEDAYLPGPAAGRSFGVPDIDGRDTLVVRTKCFHTSLDSLFDNKRCSHGALSAYTEHFRPRGLLLPQWGPGPVVRDEGDDAPFPNVVFKFPDRDAGAGIIFLKAKSCGHVREIIRDAIRANRPKGLAGRLRSIVDDHKGLYHSYIRPVMTEDRRLSKIRAHVLVTPLGSRFLSGHSVISQFPVPERLPFGVVRDSRPYLVNLASSSEYRLLSKEEEARVGEAALAVADGLSWAASYGFQTGPA